MPDAIDIQMRRMTPTVINAGRLVQPHSAQLMQRISHADLVGHLELIMNENILKYRDFAERLILIAEVDEKLTTSKPSRVFAVFEKLRPSLAHLDKAVRAGICPLQLLKAQDDKILTAAGLTESEGNLLRQALIRIRSRRHRLLGEVTAERSE